MKKLSLWIAAFALILILPDIAFAQAGGAPGAADNLMQALVNAGENWADTLRGYARRLFFLLLGIAFIWQFWPHVFKPDFNSFLADLIRFILVYGFFFLLMDQSTAWANAIVDSFREAGGAAAGNDGRLSPGDVFRLAIHLSNEVDNSRSFWPSVSDLFISLAALLIVVSFGFIAVLMFVALVEAIVVINAAVIFTGFGGSPWTRDYALVALRYAVAVGAKLFTLSLIVAVVTNAATGWLGDYTGSKSDTFSMILLALLCAYMCKTIPDLIAGLISGVSPGGGGAIGAMGAMGLAVASGGMGALAGAAAGVAGGGAANQATGGLAGLANSIGSSLAGGRPGAGGGEPTPPKPPMPPSGGGPSSGGSMGGAMSNLASGPTSSGPAQGGQSSASMQAPGTGSAMPMGGSPATTGISTGSAVIGGTAAMGQMALKGTGVLSALTVPGMESAAALPSGVPPSPPADVQQQSAESTESSEVDSNNNQTAGQGSSMANVIRPADPGEAPPPPSENTDSSRKNRPEQED